MLPMHVCLFCQTYRQTIEHISNALWLSVLVTQVVTTVCPSSRRRIAHCSPLSSVRRLFIDWLSVMDIIETRRRLRRLFQSVAKIVASSRRFDPPFRSCRLTGRRM